MTTQPARKYNPGFLTDPELVDTFCVRQIEFKSVLDTLRGCIGPANQPQIVIGPRGSGKTTLLLRVAAEVRGDPALSSRFFPVLFAEESYEVSTAGEFWLECLSQLADQAPVRPEDPDLHRTAEALRGDMDDRSLADRCLGALLDFADRENKRLVLFVENLNMMFRDMADPDAGWRLRQVLQTEPRIVLIASATNRFDEMDHPDHAFYDMFRVCVLRRLDTAECAALWERVSGRKVEQRTIRSLEILTGGSPRLIAIVARFGAARSFRNLMDELLDLVDDHTEYFKSHLEALPPQERRVYLALADLWKPATTREIAERCRLGTSKCSAQLTRLMERDIVQVEGGTARRKEYYLAERLYNIYYLLRRRRGHAPLVEALVRFMRSCYAPSELDAISRQMRRELADLDPGMWEMYQTALDQLTPQKGGSREEAVALFNQGVNLLHEERLEEALSVLDDVSRRFGDSQEPTLREPVCAALADQATALGRLNRPTDSLAVSERLLGRFGTSEMPSLRKHVAKALVNRGAALAGLDRHQDAMEAWEEVERRFGAREHPDLVEPVAMALVNKAGALGVLNRPHDALGVLEVVVARFGESHHPAVLRQVAIALVNKGATLRERNQLEDAVAAWEEVVHRFGRSADPGLRGQVAKALVNQGTALVEMDRTEDALSAWDDVVGRYGAAEGIDLLVSIGKALSNKGFVLDTLGRQRDAVAVCDDIVRRFGDGEVLALRGLVGRALVLKGTVLSRMDRPNDALAAYDEVTRRHGESESPDLHHWRHMALLGRADIQLKGGQYGAVIETVGLVLGDGQAKPSEMRWRAHAIRAHAALMQADAAAAACDLKELLEILGQWDSPPRETIQSLLILTVGVGPEKMICLIEASPAKDFLLPLTTALEWELGRRPRVPLEVEEVAEDVRRDLAELKKSQPVPPS